MGILREDMKRAVSCGLPPALEVMGERWSFLILRAAFNGYAHFEEFSSQLGIARNILSNRLARLVDHGVLERIPEPAGPAQGRVPADRKGLRPAPRDARAAPVGEKYTMRVPANPVLVDARDGAPIAPIRIRAADGRELGWHDLAWQERERVGQPAER